jgi:hypothetical protein
MNEEDRWTAAFVEIDEIGHAQRGRRRCSGSALAVSTSFTNTEHVTVARSPSISFTLARSVSVPSMGVGLRSSSFNDFVPYE